MTLQIKSFTWTRQLQHGKPVPSNLVPQSVSKGRMMSGKWLYAMPQSTISPQSKQHWLVLSGEVTVGSIGDSAVVAGVNCTINVSSMTVDGSIEGFENTTINSTNQSNGEVASFADSTVINSRNQQGGHVLGYRGTINSYNQVSGTVAGFSTTVVNEQGKRGGQSSVGSGGSLHSDAPKQTYQAIARLWRVPKGLVSNAARSLWRHKDIPQGQYLLVKGTIVFDYKYVEDDPDPQHGGLVPWLVKYLFDELGIKYISVMPVYSDGQQFVVREDNKYEANFKAILPNISLTQLYQKLRSSSYGEYGISMYISQYSSADHPRFKYQMTEWITNDSNN